jgi:NADPH:quinone reductase-like Zn-dependent oxidoreductase
MARNETRAVILPAYNDNLLRAMLTLQTGSRPIPALQAGEVLVEMEAAPCNPSDIAFLRGGYNIVKPLPAVPGFEGTGTVVETGDASRDLLGKRVSCFVQARHDGTWADHFIARRQDCIVLKEGIKLEQAACLAVNPLTALGMLDMVLERGARAIILNAAGGQVPRIMNSLASTKGIAVVNLVRKEPVAAALKEEGFQHVLNTSDEDFPRSLAAITEKLRPTMAFDAVAGGLAGQILNTMPDGSVLTVYGALSGAPLDGIDPMGIIFRKKVVTGFNLNDWIASKSPEAMDKTREELQELVLAGVINTEVQGAFRLDKVTEGLRAYIKSMSAGKVLFTP